MEIKQLFKDPLPGAKVLKAGNGGARQTGPR